MFAAAGVALQVVIAGLRLPRWRAVVATGLGAVGSGVALAEALAAGGHSLAAVGAAAGVRVWAATELPRGRRRIVAGDTHTSTIGADDRYRPGALRWRDRQHGRRAH